MIRRRPVLFLLIVGLVLVLGVYLGGSWLFASAVLYLPPQSLADDRAQSAGFAAQGLPEPEEITIDGDGVTLSGFLFENQQPAGCGAILLHGFLDTRYGALQYAPLFWERGCHILAYDHRGHGASSPAPHTFGFYEKQDVISALDWFAAETGLDRSEIGIAGVSYGAAAALQAAPDIPEVAFILADSSYQDLRTILDFQATEQFGVVGRFFFPGALRVAEATADFDADEVSPQEAIRQAAMPVYLVHSLQDETTPAFHSETIYDHSDPNRTVLRLNDWGSPHARDILTDYDRYRAEFAAFLDAFAPAFGRPVSP